MASSDAPCGAVSSERRQVEPVPRLGVDEKSFRKRHCYLTLVNDLDRGRVLYVAAGRRQAMSKPCTPQVSERHSRLDDLRRFLLAVEGVALHFQLERRVLDAELVVQLLRCRSD